MNKDRFKNNQAVLLVSFLPLLIHVIRHLMTYSYFPLLFTLLLVIVFTILWKLRIITSALLVKIWSIVLIGYGIIRLVLSVLVLLTGNSVPSDVYFQIDIWYFSMSVFVLFSGIWIFRRKKSEFYI